MPGRQVECSLLVKRFLINEEQQSLKQTDWNPTIYVHKSLSLFEKIGQLLFLFW